MVDAKQEHPVRHGVIATVVGGLILALLSWFTPFLSWVGSLFSAVWAHVVSSISVPRWLFYPLVVVSLVCVIVGIVKLFGKKDPRRQYTSDIFHGMNWRWYLDGNLHPHNLRCFCPEDSTRLVYSNDSLWERSATFHCETCGRRWGPIDGNQHDAIAMIERQIERKINTGEWKQVVEDHDRDAKKSK